MQLKPIERNDWDAAASVLVRGFQERPPSFWSDGLARLQSNDPTGITRNIGYLLQNDGKNVGIILTFRTSRTDRDGSRRDIVNLSSWYVDRCFRWYAPSMLKQLVGERDAIYTDLSASPRMSRVLHALQFSEWNQGLLAASLPQTMFAWRRGARVYGLDDAPAGALTDADRRMLEDHARMGCIVCVLIDRGVYHPLIFLRRVRRGIPFARLIYAPSRRAVIASLPNILYFLLRSKVALVVMESDRDECPRYCFFFKDRARKFYKGNFDSDRIDFAYSEAIFFDFENGLV